MGPICRRRKDVIDMPRRGTCGPRSKEQTERIRERIKEMQLAISVLEKLADDNTLPEKRATTDAGIDYHRYRRYVYDETWLSATADSDWSHIKMEDMPTLTWQERMWLDIHHIKISELKYMPLDVTESINSALADLMLSGHLARQRMCQILIMRYRDRMTLFEVANELSTSSLSVTPERVHQLENRGIALLEFELPIIQLDNANFVNLRAASEELHETNVKRIQVALKLLKSQEENEQIALDLRSPCDIPIDELGLPNKIRNRLMAFHIRSVGDILETTDEQLKAIPQISKLTISLIRDNVDKFMSKR
jgi:hypothetical protein